MTTQRIWPGSNGRVVWGSELKHVTLGQRVSPEVRWMCHNHMATGNAESENIRRGSVPIY